MIKKRKIGRSSLETAPLVFGGNVFGWTADEPRSFQLLDAFVAAGFNFIDTADMYSTWVAGNKGGESETIIGKWMKERRCRERVLIATKVGMEMGPGKKGLSKSYIIQAVEDSLRRLQTDTIDLYFSHVDDLDRPVEEPLEVYAHLIRQGKVKAIAASNFTASRLEQALKASQQNGIPRYECLQPLYNLCDRSEFEKELEPLCKKHGLGVIPYFSLASGFLTGKYRSEEDLKNRRRADFVKQYLNERGFRILDALDQVAKQTRSNPAQVALAWLIAHPTITAPVASATNLHQLHELIQATSLHLDAGSIKTLNEASNTIYQN